MRHARMATSAFAFYRGAALLMAADLAAMPRTTLNVQLCGDAHLSNFGLFAAPDRSVIFDVNDFDETHPGPFEWDVKRLATSFVLAARDNGLPRKVGLAAAEAAAASYRESMAAFAGKGELEIWYDRIDASGARRRRARPARRQGEAGGQGRGQGARRTLRGAVAKARLRDAWSAIAKITEVVDGHRRFRDQPPLLTRLELGHECRGDRELGVPGVPGHPAGRPAGAAEALRDHRHGPQGGRGRQRRPAGVRAAAPRSRRGRPHRAAGQAGAGLGAGGLHPQVGVHQARPPGGHRAAADAGGQRLLPRLDRWARGAQLLRAGS